MSAPPNPEHWLPPRRVRQRFSRASTTYDDAAGVLHELRGRLLERLDLVRLAPAVVFDLGAGTGLGTRALQDRYPRAHVIALDSAFGMSQQSRRRRGWWRRFEVVCADAQQLPFADRSADLVFSHLMLPWCNEPDAVFGEVARVLRPGGLFMFTSFGPDTARELRHAAGTDRVRVHTHIDMHDIGDALLRAGFGDPVMDVETVTATYDSTDRLLNELQKSGATNASLGLRSGLSARSSTGQLRERYEAFRRDGRLPFSLEVVYGHAWSVERKARAPSGEYAIPVTRIGRRSRG